MNWDKRGDEIRFAGCRNNAYQLISSIISTAESPEKAEDALKDLISRDVPANLIKALWKEDTELRGEILNG